MGLTEEEKRKVEDSVMKILLPIFRSDKKESEKIIAAFVKGVEFWKTQLEKNGGE